MSTVPKLGQRAIEHARRGDFREALKLAKLAMASRPSDGIRTLSVGVGAIDGRAYLAAHEI